MKTKPKTAARSRHSGLIEDTVGAISLFILLFAGLGLTGPF
jgi:hypothetical protein